MQSTVVGHSNADIMMPVVSGSFSQVYSSCKVLGTAREQTVTIVEAGQWQRRTLKWLQQKNSDKTNGVNVPEFKIDSSC